MYSRQVHEVGTRHSLERDQLATLAYLRIARLDRGNPSGKPCAWARFSETPRVSGRHSDASQKTIRVGPVALSLVPLLSQARIADCAMRKGFEGLHGGFKLWPVVL